MVCLDQRAFAENRRALQYVPKLSNVSWPLISKKGLSCLARQTCGLPPEGPADLLQKGFAQRHDIGGTFA